MTSEKYISVGKLGKPHGLSGAFRFLLSNELKSKKKVPRYFMVEQRGSFLPWFINKIEWLGFNEGLISFEEITTVEKAKEYNRKELFLTEKDFDQFFKKDATGLNYLIGYKASEKSNGGLGIIKEIIENPGQVLCMIIRDGNELVIPLVDEFILDINKRKKEIIFNLPEGLLDL